MKGKDVLASESGPAADLAGVLGSFAGLCFSVAALAPLIPRRNPQTLRAATNLNVEIPLVFIFSLSRRVRDHLAPRFDLF